MAGDGVPRVREPRAADPPRGARLPGPGRVARRPGGRRAGRRPPGRHRPPRREAQQHAGHARRPPEARRLRHRASQVGRHADPGGLRHRLAELPRSRGRRRPERHPGQRRLVARGHALPRGRRRAAVRRQREPHGHALPDRPRGAAAHRPGRLARAAAARHHAPRPQGPVDGRPGRDLPRPRPVRCRPSLREHPGDGGGAPDRHRAPPGGHRPRPHPGRARCRGQRRRPRSRPRRARAPAATATGGPPSCCSRWSPPCSPWSSAAGCSPGATTTPEAGSSPGSGSSQDSSSPPASSDAPSDAGPTAQGMEDFAASYLATVTEDPATTWKQLTPAFQARAVASTATRASGGPSTRPRWSAPPATPRT